METALIIVMIVIASFSIIANTLVLYDIFMHHFQSFRATTTRLITLLHISCLLQNICGIPYLYTESKGLCAFMGFAHYYFGLINVLDIMYLTIAYYYFVTAEGRTIVSWIRRYGVLFAWVFSLITLIPFGTNSYGRSDIWCTLDVSNSRSNYWSFFVFYFWVTLATIFCSFVCIYILIYAAKHDALISKRLFTSLGLYIVISICCFIPRMAPRIAGLIQPGYQTPDVFSFLSGIPMYVAGLSYCVCFYFNSEILKSYERQSNSNDQS
eukprot:gene15686-17601_t